MSRIVSAMALAGFVQLLPRPALAQAGLTDAVIQGTVADESGVVVPSAIVVVLNVETNLRRTSVTDERGRYFLAALPPGPYRIMVELRGFTTHTREDVMLSLGQSANVNFTLPLVRREEGIKVTAEHPLVDVSQTAVASLVGLPQIQGLPINGRNFISFSVITPGVTTDRTPQQGASATSGLSFAGQRARSNNIMVDGVDNNDPVVGAVRASFSQEAVREFQVLTNSYSAEFGKASGGVINIVTKSGTNEVRGNAFYYFRDDALNARNHFEKVDVFGSPINREKAPFHQDQFGATLGGPLKKDRTFFFLSFERGKTRASNFVNVDPAAAEILRANGFPVELGNVAYDFQSSELLAKVNHEWRANHSLVVRAGYSDTTNENIEPFGGLVARSRGAIQLRKDWSFAVSETDVFGEKWVSEARIQFARQDQKINSLDPTCDGPCDREDEGGPTLEVTGVASVGRQRFAPQPRLNDRIQIMETVSCFAGSHRLKAGMDFNFLNERGGALPLHFGGRYIFSSLPAIPGLLPEPVTAIQALALGLPAAYVQGYGASADPYKYRDLSLFIQDEWRVTNRLTLKPGVRYQKQFWPDVSYDVSTTGGTRFQYTFPQDSNNFAPRIAAAYDVTGDGKTSVHGAYGLFFDNHVTAIIGVTELIKDGPKGVRTLVLRFPASIAAWRSPGHRLPEPGTVFPSTQISIDPSLETPYAHQATVGFDRAFGSDLSLAANIVYVRGKRQLGTLDYNPILPLLGPGRRPNDVGGRAGTSASVLQYTDFGETWYRGLTVALSRRFRDRHQFLAAYTFSKAEDNSTDFQSAFIPQDNGRGRNPADLTGLPLNFDAGLEKGPSIQDQRHRFVLSGLYRFPLDIQVSTIVTAASGRPYTPLAGADLNGDGDGGAFPSDRARRNPAVPGTSVGRNSRTMSKQINVDMRLSKTFRIGRRAAVEAIVEAFNLFDRTSFSEINNIFGRGAFPDEPQKDSLGRVTYGLYEQALPPRQVQLALRVSF